MARKVDRISCLFLALLIVGRVQVGFNDTSTNYIVIGCARPILQSSIHVCALNHLVCNLDVSYGVILTVAARCPRARKLRLHHTLHLAGIDHHVIWIRQLILRLRLNQLLALWGNLFLETFWRLVGCLSEWNAAPIFVEGPVFSLLGLIERIFAEALHLWLHRLLDSAKTYASLVHLLQVYTVIGHGDLLYLAHSRDSS